MSGYVPADGTGDNGVLVVLEAAGEEEAKVGRPTMGKAGFFLWHNLKRVGVEREGFRIHNVLSCRPPDNKLAGMWYESAVIEKCAPNLDATISQHVAHRRAVGKTPVIITLGKIAVQRVMGVELSSSQLALDYICYPLWNNRYGCWVVAADHPSYLMRGKTELLPVLQFAFQRALEIADKGLVLDNPKIGTDYLLNPTLNEIQRWVDEFELYAASHPDTLLSYDIETPHKKNADEADLEKDEDDYVILQVAFSYKPNHGLSVPWNAETLPQIARIFASTCDKVGWNNMAFDDPRIMTQIPIHGDRYDAMQMWHVLNSSLPKGLGFVTPFYVPTTSLWKYLGAVDIGLNGAYYNCKDADMALRNALGIRDHLKKSDLWDVYMRHMVEVHRVFTYMSEQGVLFDLTKRSEAERLVADALENFDRQIQLAVPVKAKPLKVYKKTPKVTDGLIQTPGTTKVTQCPRCGAQRIKAAHFKSIGKKKLKAGEPENPCLGLKAEKVTVNDFLWAKVEDFKLSKKSLQTYQDVVKHKPVIIVDKKTKERKVTFDEKAIIKLTQRYPEDALYKVILDYRSNQKLLGTYIGVTKYIEVEVPDDYELQPGEKLKDAL